jgi:hypothetical protein
MKQLNKGLEDVTEEMNNLKLIMGEWAQQGSNEASDRIKKALPKLKEIEDKRAEFQGTITAAINDLFNESVEQRRESLFKPSSFSMAMASETACWSLEKDTLANTKGNDTMSPFFQLVGTANMLASDMTVIRILYFGDNDLNDLLAPLENRQEDLLRFDVANFCDRIMEGRRATHRALKQGVADKKIVELPDRKPLAVHFWVPTQLLGDFFGGIHELRAKLMQARMAAIRNPVTPISRPPKKDDDDDDSDDDNDDEEEGEKEGNGELEEEKKSNEEKEADVVVAEASQENPQDLSKPDA